MGMVELLIVNRFEVYTPEVSPQTEDPITNLYDGKADAVDNQPPPKVTDSISRFPVILCDEIPWEHSVRYFLDKLQSIKPPQATTLVSAGRDLKDFKQWIEDEDIDYLSCDRPIKSPVRQYRKFLIVAENMSPSVKARRLSHVVAFYRWLQDCQGVKFKAPLWQDRDVTLVFQLNAGLNHARTVKSTDIQRGIGHQANKNKGLDGVIVDGGQLTPLTMAQQQLLFGCLNDIGNTEMTLSFLIALTTGARLQSVFTLRKIHFSYEPRHDQKEVIIYAGSWTPNQHEVENNLGTKYAQDIDTKNGKRLKLYFPVWLYRRVQTYINSPRATRRYDKPLHNFQDPEMQYVFLTTRRKPFYAAKNDDMTQTYIHPPLGASVQQFISSQLKPLLKKASYDHHFKFHNLRASYGMNIVRKHLPFVGKEGHLGMGELMMYVRDRMGHNSMATTELYLKYDASLLAVKKANEDYGDHLNEQAVFTRGLDNE